MPLNDSAEQFARERDAWSPSLLRDMIPRVRPYQWQDVTPANIADGLMFRNLATSASVIVTCSVEEDRRRWLHVSIARPDRLPSYDELREAKDLFVGRNRNAIMVLPKADKHVNFHPHCLHLWACLDGDVWPDFTSGRAEGML